MKIVKKVRKIPEGKPIFPKGRPIKKYPSKLFIHPEEKPLKERRKKEKWK